MYQNFKLYYPDPEIVGGEEETRGEEYGRGAGSGSGSGNGSGNGSGSGTRYGNGSGSGSRYGSGSSYSFSYESEAATEEATLDVEKVVIPPKPFVETVTATSVNNTSFEIRIPSENVNITPTKLFGGIGVSSTNINNNFTSKIKGNVPFNMTSGIAKYTITAKEGYCFVKRPKIKITSIDASDYSVVASELEHEEDNLLTSISYTIGYKPNIKRLNVEDPGGIDIKYSLKVPRSYLEENKLELDTRSGEVVPVQKEIKSIRVEDQEKYIPQGGGVRRITIKGSAGSKFSLTLKDSSDCSILKEELDIFNVDIPSTGVFNLDQRFPSIETKGGVRTTKETYTLKVIPAADVKFANQENLIPKDIVMYQYADPTITFTNVETGNGVITGSDITKKGTAGEYSDNIRNYSSSTYTLTAAHASGGSSLLYVSGNPVFNDSLSSSTAVKKVIDRCDMTGLTNQLVLKPAAQVSTGSAVTSTYTDDLVVGMEMKATVSKTKTVRASSGTTDCNKATTKFEVDSTDDLFVGMEVSGRGVVFNRLVSIDCERTITLAAEEVIEKNVVLTFKKDFNSRITKVVTNNNSSGKAEVFVGTKMDIPHGTELTFEDNETKVQGNIVHSGSGTTSVTLTTTVDVVKFGKKDATFTLNLDDFLSDKPNAFDKDFVVKKSTATILDMIVGDSDANAASKTYAVTGGPYHGTTSVSTTNITYTPHTGFTGDDSFTFTTRAEGVTGNEKTVRIKVK